MVSYVSVPVTNPQTGTTTYKMLRQSCTYTCRIHSHSRLDEHDRQRYRRNSKSDLLADAFGVHSVYHRGQRCRRDELVRAELNQPIRLDISTGGDRSHLQIFAPGSQYTYSLVGLPGESTSQSSASNLTNPTGPGCGFAATGSGTYANQLCFADFTGVTESSSQFHGYVPDVTRPIANTPYTLNFCISVSRNNVAPATIPTYYSPQGDNSEAFLGNNGFYTGIPGDPALYQNSNGITTVYLTNVKVLDAAGEPATGWTPRDRGRGVDRRQRVDGLPVQPSLVIAPEQRRRGNPWGNACYDTRLPRHHRCPGVHRPHTRDGQPTSAPVQPTTTAHRSRVKGLDPATGVSFHALRVEQQLNKTGTMMLQAQEPTGSSRSDAYRLHAGCRAWRRCSSGCSL